MNLKFQMMNRGIQTVRVALFLCNRYRRKSLDISSKRRVTPFVEHERRLCCKHHLHLITGYQVRDMYSQIIAPLALI